MEQVEIHDASWRLAQLVGRVEAGEEVVLTRGGKAVARIVRFSEREGDRSLRAAVNRVRLLRGAMKLSISREDVREAVAKGRA